jgi:hypothetical protein
MSLANECPSTTPSTAPLTHYKDCGGHKWEKFEPSVCGGSSEDTEECASHTDNLQIEVEKGPSDSAMRELSTNMKHVIFELERSPWSTGSGACMSVQEARFSQLCKIRQSSIIVESCGIEIASPGPTPRQWLRLSLIQEAADPCAVTMQGPALTTGSSVVVADYNPADKLEESFSDVPNSMATGSAANLQRDPAPTTSKIASCKLLIAIFFILLLWALLAAALVGVIIRRLPLKLEDGELLVGSTTWSKAVKAEVSQTLLMTKEGLRFVSLHGDVTIDQDGKSTVQQWGALPRGFFNASAIRYDTSLFAEDRETQSLTLQDASIQAKHLQLSTGLTSDSTAHDRAGLTLLIDNSTLQFTPDGRLTILSTSHLFTAGNVAYTQGPSMKHLTENLAFDHISAWRQDTAAFGLEILAIAIHNLQLQLRNVSGAVFNRTGAETGLTNQSSPVVFDRRQFVLSDGYVAITGEGVPYVPTNASIWTSFSGNSGDLFTFSDALDLLAEKFAALSASVTLPLPLPPNSVSQLEISNGSITDAKISAGGLTAKSLLLGDGLCSDGRGALSLQLDATQFSITEGTSGAALTGKGIPYEPRDKNLWKDMDPPTLSGAVDSLMLYLWNISNSSFALQNGSVHSHALESKAVTGEKIADATIRTIHMENGTVTESKLADSSVTTSKLSNESVLSSKIASSAVETWHLQNFCVDTMKLKNNAVTSDKVQPGAINREHLANSSIDSSKLIEGCVNSAKISAKAVNESHLTDRSVSSVKLQFGAATSSIIASNAVSSNHLQESSVTSSKVANFSLYGHHLRLGRGLAVEPNGHVGVALNATQFASNGTTVQLTGVGIPYQKATPQSFEGRTVTTVSSALDEIERKLYGTNLSSANSAPFDPTTRKLFWPTPPPTTVQAAIEMIVDRIAQMAVGQKFYFPGPYANDAEAIMAGLTPREAYFDSAGGLRTVRPAG